MIQTILTDLTGATLGEVRNASDRKVVLPHMRVPTAEMTVPLWHEHAATMMDTDCMLKFYRIDPVTSTRTLIFNGPIVSAEESGEGRQTVRVNAAGPMWRLAHRYIGNTKAGVSFGVGTTRDLGLIAHDILDIVNGGNFSGISKGTRTASSSGTYGPVWIKNAAEAITELAAGVNSFEYVVDPSEPTSVGGVGGWPQIGLMRIAPVIGATQLNAIFEYGTGARNVASYNRKVDREGLCNSAIISLNGWPDAPEGGLAKDLIFRTDSTSITARGIFSAPIPDNGVTDDTLRTQIADFHLLLRKNPRQQITFKPARNARPAPFVDYNVGDTVRARAAVRGSLRFDNLFRIWGLTVNVDSNGNEDVELELVMP